VVTAEGDVHHPHLLKTTLGGNHLQQHSAHSMTQHTELKERQALQAVHCIESAARHNCCLGNHAVGLQGNSATVRDSCRPAASQHQANVHVSSPLLHHSWLNPQLQFMDVAPLALLLQLPGWLPVVG
jgi:hypothetical protein